MLRNSSSVGVDCDRGRCAWAWWYVALSILLGLSGSPQWVIVWLSKLLGREGVGYSFGCVGTYVQRSWGEIWSGF